jgi:hypothetical protein
LPPASAAASSAPAVAPAANRCLPNGAPAAGAEPPTPGAAAPPPPGPCRARDAAAEARAAGALAQRLRDERDGAKLAVRFDCDPLSDPPVSLELERGSGHGGYLEMWKFTLDRRASVYETLALSTSPPRGPRGRGQGEPPPVELDYRVKRGAVPAAEFERALRDARPLLVARVTIGARTYFRSSRDFHQVLRLADGAGRALERRYTGYEGDRGQADYLPTEAAFAALEPLLRTLPWSENVPASERERRFFARQFARASEHFGDETAWWVRELYVELARSLGGPDLVPPLLRQLTPAGPAGADPSGERTRASVVEALAAITGWDARREPGRPELTIEEAARAYLDECGRALGGVGGAGGR